MLDPASIVAVNALQRAGNPAFHIRVSLSVLDAKSKPVEQGQIDYWWGPSGTELDLALPSAGTVHTFDLKDLPSDKARRGVFLAEQVLRELVNPGAALGPRDVALVSDTGGDGVSTLDCFHAVMKSKATVVPPQVCADRVSGTIRVIRRVGETVARNRTGLFGQTRVALDAEISYGHTKVVSGHVEQMEGFNKSPVALTRTHMMERPDGTESDSRISGPPIKYPAAALQTRSQGTVVLGVQISEAGVVEVLVPVLEVNPLLTRAAMDAARQYRFKPALFEGEPEPVQTGLIADFTMNTLQPGP